MKRKTLRHYNTKDEAFTHLWVLEVSLDRAITFCVRMPTSRWHYYLPMGVDIHSTSPFNDLEDSVATNCECLNGQPCYANGSALAGRELWEEYIASGDEELIWAKLESWANRS